METTTGAGPVVAAADLRAALRHRWWVLVIGALLGVAAAAVAVKIVPLTYSATTSIIVTPTGEENIGGTNTPGGKDKLVNMDTESQIVTSAAVADAVRGALKTPTSASDLVDEITVEVAPNTTVLSITAVAATPTDAQRLSREFAKAYLAQRESSAKGAIAAQVKIYQTRIADVTKQLQTVTGQISSLAANSPDRAFAEARQRILVDQVTNLSSQLSSLEAITVTPGRVLSEAQLPTDPDQPPAILLLAAGFLFGLLCGLGVAVLLAKLDRRIRRAADLQALGDVPLLGTIPPSRSGGGSGALPGVAPSASPIGQAFGQIRNDVTTALPMRPATLLVAGTDVGPGGSQVAANLAVALARSGSPVLLVCADFAGSSVERMLGLEGLSRADGLAEALAGQSDPVTLLRAAPVVPGLWVMGAGRGRDSAAELLQSRQLEWVLSTVRGESFVILEAPPTSSGADAQAMARLCDAAILVAEVGRSRLDAIDDGSHQLARVGTPLLGVVVTQRQSAQKRKHRGQPVSVPVDRPTLGETTVAIRADQLKSLRNRAPKELGGESSALPPGLGHDAEAHASAASGRSGEDVLDGLSADGHALPGDPYAPRSYEDVEASFARTLSDLRGDAEAAAHDGPTDEPTYEPTDEPTDDGVAGYDAGDERYDLGIEGYESTADGDDPTGLPRPRGAVRAEPSDGPAEARR